LQPNCEQSGNGVFCIYTNEQIEEYDAADPEGTVSGIFSLFPFSLVLILDEMGCIEERVSE
jgi:hypothetical protein